MISSAADAFDPLAPGAYPGAIEPGAFVEHVVRNGNRHGALGLRLSIGKGEHRVVRCSFLLESPTALGAARRDAEMLARWADLVDAVPARNWHGLLKNLWLGQRRLSVGLDFTIRPSERGQRLRSSRYTDESSDDQDRVRIHDLYGDGTRKVRRQADHARRDDRLRSGEVVAASSRWSRPRSK